MTQIWFDCDGVLAEFTEAYLRIFNALHRDPDGRPRVVKSEITRFEFTSCISTKLEDDAVWRAIDATPGFVTGLDQIPGALATVEWARTLPGVSVGCLTSPHTGPHWMEKRYAWLANHMGIKKRDVVLAANKGHAHGDILIDDKGENCDEFAAANPAGVAILFSSPWNGDYKLQRYNTIYANGWPQVRDVIERWVK